MPIANSQMPLFSLLTLHFLLFNSSFLFLNLNLNLNLNLYLNLYLLFFLTLARAIQTFRR